MKYAVVDSGPLIRGLRLEALGAERLVTVPEVLGEIRDKRARHTLATLPVELETREPSDEAIAAITSFAKLTGDAPVLSAVDTRVLALAWMLEKETKGGVDHLRQTPPAPARPRAAHIALRAAPRPRPPRPRPGLLLPPAPARAPRPGGKMWPSFMA